LAILVPAETPVRDRFRADVLEAAENGVLFGDLKRLPEDFDVYESLVRAENLIRSAGIRYFRTRNFGLL
jgi:hypothetical protein